MTVTGVLLDIEMTLVSASTCAPLAGYAVYLWHCDNLGELLVVLERRHESELAARRDAKLQLQRAQPVEM